MHRVGESDNVRYFVPWGGYTSEADAIGPEHVLKHFSAPYWR